MEAKDTVMKIIDNIFFFGHKPPKPIKWEEVREQIIKAIDEQDIKHKADLKEAEKAGIQKVVDWVNNYEGLESVDGVLVISIKRDDWQAFLKEVEK